MGPEANAILPVEINGFHLFIWLLLSVCLFVCFYGRMLGKKSVCIFGYYIRASTVVTFFYRDREDISL